MGFSDHIPYKEANEKNCRMLYSQKAEYIATMKQLQEAYRDQIEIRYGYEYDCYCSDDDVLVYGSQIM